MHSVCKVHLSAEKKGAFFLGTSSSFHKPTYNVANFDLLEGMDMSEERPAHLAWHETLELHELVAMQ